MHHYILLAYLAMSMTISSGLAAYRLEDDYMNGDFFSQFTFFTDPDPTNGTVLYQSQAAAEQQGLISSSSGNVRMSVNSRSKAPGGRQSVRITSNKAYQSGLFIVDLEHMPGGICGTWPAFWTTGPDWPYNGEIDIIEGVNNQARASNQMVLHTGQACTIRKSGGMSGTVTSPDCLSSDGSDEGCVVNAESDQSYGTGFNSAGGGVYAMDWTNSYIDIYFFPRSSIPSDVSGGSPNPASWGEPTARFSVTCDLSSSVQSQQIVFDTTFCGNWAGDAWNKSSCPSSTGSSTCAEFVENNPRAFKEAYWSINSLKVYSNGGGAAPAPVSSGAQSAPQSVAPSAAPTASTATYSSPHTTRKHRPGHKGRKHSHHHHSPPNTFYTPSPTSYTAATVSSAAPSSQTTQYYTTQNTYPTHTWGQPWQTGGFRKRANEPNAVMEDRPAAPIERATRHMRKREDNKVHRAGRL